MAPEEKEELKLLFKEGKALLLNPPKHSDSDEETYMSSNQRMDK